MGLPSPAMGYNGIVMDGQGHRINVSDGILRLGQKEFHIDEDGKVMDNEDKQVAFVKNGRLQPVEGGQ